MSARGEDPGLDWLRAPCRERDRAAEQAARERQERLTKPRGALGRLEELAVRLAGLQGDPRPAVDPVCCLLFAADHGVVSEGVSAYPQAVTAQMVGNIAAGGAAISVLARALDARLSVIDCGVAGGGIAIPGVLQAQVAPGTRNLAEEPAMDRTQLAEALAVGRDAAERAAGSASEAPARLLVAGEMGIGNTTAAAALSCALLGLGGAALAGPGTGLDPEGVARKAAVLDRALARHRAGPGGAHGSADSIGALAEGPVTPAMGIPLRALADLGGFEIAAITGCALRAAQLGVPLLVDGFIATAAVLAACRIQPGVRPWLIFAHTSAEPGHARLLAALEADPLLDLGLRLGEGSGAALAVPLLRLACALHGGMATFESAGVSDADGPPAAPRAPSS